MMSWSSTSAILVGCKELRPLYRIQNLGTYVLKEAFEGTACREQLPGLGSDRIIQEASSSAVLACKLLTRW